MRRISSSRDVVSSKTNSSYSDELQILNFAKFCYVFCFKNSYSLRSYYNAFCSACKTRNKNHFSIELEIGMIGTRKNFSGKKKFHFKWLFRLHNTFHFHFGEILSCYETICKFIVKYKFMRYA